MKRSLLSSGVLTAAVVVSGAANAKVVVAPLRSSPPPVPSLFAATERTVAVNVLDRRPDKSLLGGGIVGPGGEKGKGIYLGYATEKEGDLADFLAAAAGDAVGVVGMKRGEGGASLEIVVEQLWIDMYRLSGFSPMNCIAYGTLVTTLHDSGGGLLAQRTSRLTFWENTWPVGSMKEVSKEALSRIFQQAAWQVTAEVLLDAFQPAPDPAALARVVADISGQKEEVPARQMVFWLGLSRQIEGPVAEKLLALLQSSDQQRVHQAAAEAVGRLELAGARDTLESILAGAKKGGWDNADTEHVWYLLQGLALLGDTGLAAKIPKTQLKVASKLDDLIRFHDTGQAPELSPEESKKLAEAKSKLAKKSRG